MALTGTPDRTVTGSELPATRGPDPMALPPGAGLYAEDWPILSQTSYAYVDGEVTHTVTTTVRRGIRPGMELGASTSGTDGSAALAGTCSYIGTNNITR